MTDTFQHRLSVLKELRGRENEDGTWRDILIALRSDGRFALLWEMIDRLEACEAALERIKAATPNNTNSPTAESMASWTNAVAGCALSQQPQESGVASLASERPQPEGGVGVKPSEGEQ